MQAEDWKREIYLEWPNPLFNPQVQAIYLVQTVSNSIDGKSLSMQVLPQNEFSRLFH